MIEQTQYRRLLDEIATQLGHRRGWQRRAAAALGVSPSFISKVLNHGQSIGTETIRCAHESCGVPLEYFTDASMAPAAFVTLPVVTMVPDDDGDAELAAIAAVAALDPEARKRVLGYLVGRYGA